MEDKSLVFELEHVGITTNSLDEAHATADTLCALFNLNKRLGKKSVFAGDYFEVMRAPFLGKNGHIAMRTDDLDEAVRQLEARGVQFNYDTVSYGTDGKMTNIYLKDEIAGFAFHILCKPTKG